MAFFFFGTLMDREILELVLDRAVAARELVLARLPGYRRVRVGHASYPMLVPDAAGVIEGRLLLEPSRRDVIRIRHFEDDEYTDHWLPVQRADGRRQEARVFFALDGFGQSGEPWDLEAWARAEKPDYLALCREWMADCEV